MNVFPTDPRAKRRLMILLVACAVLAGALAATLTYMRPSSVQTQTLTPIAEPSPTPEMDSTFTSLSDYEAARGCDPPLEGGGTVLSDSTISPSPTASPDSKPPVTYPMRDPYTDLWNFPEAGALKEGSCYGINFFQEAYLSKGVEILEGDDATFPPGESATTAAKAIIRMDYFDVPRLTRIPRRRVWDVINTIQALAKLYGVKDVPEAFQLPGQEREITSTISALSPDAKVDVFLAPYSAETFRIDKFTVDGRPQFAIDKYGRQVPATHAVVLYRREAGSEVLVADGGTIAAPLLRKPVNFLPNFCWDVSAADRSKTPVVPDPDAPTRRVCTPALTDTLRIPIPDL